jgi:hypothetical protein
MESIALTLSLVLVSSPIESGGCQSYEGSCG